MNSVDKLAENNLRDVSLALETTLYISRESSQEKLPRNKLEIHSLVMESPGQVIIWLLT